MHAFTLVEMMVAVAVLALLMGIIIAITNSVTKTVRWNNSKLEAFAAARSSFDIIANRLTTATLSTYWDYDYNPMGNSLLDTSATTKPPTTYLRKSDLYFLIRANTQNPGYGQEIYFQSPESFSNNPDIRSTQGLLNACSFFVQYCDNSELRPAALRGADSVPSWRYRLMQGNQPTEDLSVYKYTYETNVDPDKKETGTEWLEDISNGGTEKIETCVTPIADNVIALIFWPRLSAGEDPDGTALTGDYAYDSRKDAFVTNPKQPVTANQLPPTIQVTLISISEASAKRLNTDSATPPDIIDSALKDKFTNVVNFKRDLADLEAVLNADHIEYQIFNTSITMRESKWSGTP